MRKGIVCHNRLPSSKSINGDMAPPGLTSSHTEARAKFVRLRLQQTMHTNLVIRHMRCAAQVQP
jgi:hypothetical protein